MIVARLTDEINMAKNKTNVNMIWDQCGRYIAAVMHDITHDVELLQKCYCEHRVREFDRKFLPQIFMPEDILTDFPNIPEIKIKEVVKLLDSRAILILGNVGTGKSTFVHYFFKVTIPNTSKWNIYLPIFVDFKGLRREDKVTYYANKTIDENLTRLCEELFPDRVRSIQTLRDVFEEDLRWNQSIYQQCRNSGRDDLSLEYEMDDIKRLQSDLVHFNKRRTQFVERQGGKRVVIILDNVDHLVLDEQIEEIFLYGQKLALDGACHVVLTMRSYNAKGKVHHFDHYSAFNPRYLHLSLPNVSEMIKARVNYALEKIGKYVQLETQGTARISMRSPLFKEEVEGYLNSFTRPEIINTLEKLSYQDLRELLRMAHRAMASGHLYPQIRRIKYSEVQVYDLIQALILGNWKYYNIEDEHIAIINLFDDECDFEKGKTTIRIRILQTIRLLGSKKVNIKNLVKYMEKIGFENEAVINSLQYLINHSLVTPSYPSGIKIIEDKVRAVSLTEKGTYYLDDLLVEPRYYGNMCYATPMYKEYVDIMKTYNKNTMEGQYQGTKLFVEFLGHREKEWEEKVVDREWFSNYTSIFERVCNSYNAHCVRTGKLRLQL